MLNALRVNTQELLDTVSLMTSDDYKERFKAEYLQTKIRRDKLQIMIKKWDEGTLEFKPKCPRDVLIYQLGTMNAYLDALIMRADIEMIDIDS